MLSAERDVFADSVFEFANILLTFVAKVTFSLCAGLVHISMLGDHNVHCSEDLSGCGLIFFTLVALLSRFVALALALAQYLG